MEKNNSIGNIRSQEEVAADIARVTDPQKALAVLEDLRARMEERYPSKNYKNLQTNLDASKGLMYQAAIAGTTVGVSTGVTHGKHFFAKLFFVDPKYSRSNVARGLIEAVKADFDEISMTSFQFGDDTDATSAKQSARQTALNTFYRQHGFVPQYPEFEERSNLGGSTLRMIWKRGDAKANHE